MQILNTSPGSTITILLDISPGGIRTSPDFAPMVLWVLAPDHTSVLPNLPAAMTGIDTGLFLYDLTIPTGGAACGSWIANVTYKISGVDYFEAYQIVVSAPYANFSVSTK
jgi:hypothetical protein